MAIGPIDWTPDRNFGSEEVRNGANGLDPTRRCSLPLVEGGRMGLAPSGAIRSEPDGLPDHACPPFHACWGALGKSLARL